MLEYFAVHSYAQNCTSTRLCTILHMAMNSIAIFMYKLGHSHVLEIVHNLTCTL